MSTEYDNISPDLIWECCRTNNAYLCKRKQGGGVQFSRDPLNLVNKHSRKYAGFINDQAIGISPDSNTVALTTKIAANRNKPASMYHTSSFSASTPGRKLYKNVVSSTAKKGYRSDLRAEAVARASAVKRTQREPKASTGPREQKSRGAKAKKAAEAKAASS